MPTQTPATRDYQRAQVALRALTYKDVTRLWALLNPAELDKTFPTFAAATLQVIRQRRDASVALARAYLTALRAGVEGDPPAIAPTPLPAGDALTALRFASVVSIKTAMTVGTPLGMASRNALVRTMGVADRLINDGGREFIRASTEADPAARGWVRVTLGTCGYCAEQAAGDHLKSGTSDFPRHDHCGCVPEPQYDNALTPEEAYVQKIMGMIERGEATEEQFRAMLLDPNISDLSRLNIEEALARLRAKAEAQAVEAAEETVKEAVREALTAPDGSVAARVEIPQETLDALVPSRGGWNTTTRAKTIAELKQTPEGRMLLKTMDSFQSGGSTAIPRLRTDIEKYLMGNLEGLQPGRISSIENVLSAIGRSDAGERALWRGMSIPGDIDTVAARYQAGEDLDLSLASFSSDKKLAQDFTLRGAGQKVRGATRTPVLVEWVGEGKRALPIEKLSKSGTFADEKEWVGAGRYQIQGVKRVKRNGVETVIVQIIQKAVW